MKEIREWLTIQDAAEYLQVSVPSIRKYIRSGKLPAYRQGNIVRIKKVDIDSFLQPIKKKQRD